MANKKHIIVYYKGDISALTLFCKQADGGICFPPLPKLCAIVEEDEQMQELTDLYAADLIKSLNELWQLDDDILVEEPAFYQQVETPDGVVTVHMVRLKLLDPPHQLIESQQCKLQPITALRGGMPTEMELLRRAYTAVMGG